MSATASKAPAAAPAFPIEKQLRELERELDMRRRAYPKWCRAGRMRTEDAYDRIEALKAAMRTLEAGHALAAELARKDGDRDSLKQRLDALANALNGKR